MDKPRIGIIRAGITGLSCALECERLGVYPDIFEKESAVGWVWASIIGKGDIIKYIWYKRTWCLGGTSAFEHNSFLVNELCKMHFIFTCRLTK